MDISSLLLLIGAAHGIFLSWVLFTRRTPGVANRLLALILFLFSSIIIFHIGFHLDQNFRLPFFSAENSIGFIFDQLLIFEIITLFIGPLTYFYIQALEDPAFRIDRGKIIHFIPAVFLIGISLPIFWVLQNQMVAENQFQFINEAIRWFVLAQFLVYILLIIRNRMSSKTLFNKSIRHKWILILIISYVTMWFFAVILGMTNASHAAWNYIWLIASVIIYGCGYLGLIKPGVFWGEKSRENKYGNSVLSKEVAERHIGKLKQFMETEKPYLQNDLSLPGLSEMTKIPHHHLSRIINERFGENFSEFINSYRVQYAKLQLHDSRYTHLNISEIGYMSGFNSLSVFNAAFKKLIKQTPSEFRINSRPE